jgi:exonuclease 3'-5' domain-containing protein 1
MAPWSKEQNMILDQWYHVPPPLSDFNESFGLHDWDDDRDEDWYDDGPTRCRDIIDTCDLHFYYAD